MKKFILAFALLIGIASFCNTSEAQNINISINIGRQPAWGPVGYDYVGYYYFPDIDCYYDVNLGYFHYYDRGRWISARYLPTAYRHYDLYGLYKVVLNVNQPWRYHHTHYRDYAKYRGRRHQVVIRDSRDNRYYSSRNNRVAWYSDKKVNHNRNDYKYNNRSDNRNKNNNNYRPDNNRNKDNNNRGNNYNRADNNKNNTRPVTNRDNNNKRYDNNKNQPKTRESRPTRSSSERSNLQLAQNPGQTRSR